MSIQHDEDADKAFKEAEDRRRRLRGVSESAESQARSSFAFQMRTKRDGWTPERKAALNEALIPLSEDRLYRTVHAAVTRSLESGSSCVVLTFPQDPNDDFALHAALEATVLLRDIGRRAQYRDEGGAFIVKLLDV